MTTRMLIDARHLEETRVAVVQGNRIEEFDFESAEHKQLKGNIYLAKVTRVEPSLQAAFVDYGGNRHGFLAFSEIHPDYYQIPKSDREALLAEEAEHAAEEERLRGEAEDEPLDAHHEDDGVDDVPEEPEGEGEDLDSQGDPDEEDHRPRGGRRSRKDEAADEVRRKRLNLRRRYKIQDVIQRRQVLLVQVVKEERGNKGAALTTYLSLAGRYCVLMPNTSHGGGISRKISNSGDRKRLKTIIADLKLPSTMGLIVRTAGLERTRVEIKRDFDYLARLWDEVRENTLGSSAPALIYRDSDLVKRAIRDLYHKDIEAVLVEGEDGYRAARGFMKLLMPSHVRRVQLHSEATPLFQRHGVEDQLGAMYQPLVQLKSGGYIVINPTEALVSIDINSGRSTREHNIEQTAFATNIEATAEIARQLRLRDMAGLVVIDFIDMEQNGHVRKVEKAMKDALKNDRARIQVGRISNFGLMEMSRQRLRTGVLEASTKACPHCEGTGLMRTASSAGLSALRMIEEEAARGRGEKVCLRAGPEAAVYVLNRKRAELAEIEARYGVSVEVLVDPTFEGARMSVDSSGPRPIAPLRTEALHAPIEDDEPEVDEEDFVEEDEVDEEERGARGEDDGEDRGGRGRRRRRRGGRNRRRDGEPGEAGEAGETDEAGEAGEAGDVGEAGGAVQGSDDQPIDLDEDEEASAEPREPGEQSEHDDEPRKRRGRRGGRRRGGRGRDREGFGDDAAPEGDLAPEAGVAPMVEPVPSEDPAPVSAGAAPELEPEAAIDDDKPKTRRRPRARKAEVAKVAAPAATVETAEAAVEAPAETGAETGAETVEAAGEEKPKPKRRSRAKKVETAAEGEAPAAEPELALVEPKAKASAKTAPAVPAEAARAAVDPADDPTNDPADQSGQGGRKGWWSRTFG